MIQNGSRGRRARDEESLALLPHVDSLA